MKVQLTLEGVECTMENENLSYGFPLYVIRHKLTEEIVASAFYSDVCKCYAVEVIEKMKHDIEIVLQDKWKREMMLKALKDFENGKQTAP